MASRPLESSALASKPALEGVLERLGLFYSRQARDRICASFEIPSAALARFAARHPSAFCDYPDPHERVCFWRELLSERAGLEDDSIPSAYLSEFDQGLYGGLLGGDVRFLAHPENGWISSMVPPLLTDWSDFDRLTLREDSLWLERYLRQLQVFVEAAQGKFGVSHFILINGLNFVFELIGATRTYLSLAECPDMVRRAIDLAFQVNLRVQRTFFDHVPLLRGGTCSNMVQWIPGRVISESVDPFHMTSRDYFEKWGREPVERVFSRFDGGVLHLHGNGRHLLEAVTSLRGLKAVFLGNDRGYPPAWSILDDLRRRAGDLPLITEIPLGDFLSGLDRHSLPGNVFYRVKGEVAVADANRWMERVRACRQPV
jgi:hypothetical protein